MPNKLLDTYLGSKELKKLVIQRSEELEIPFRYICHDIGISYTDFMRSYINSTTNGLQISEEKFERILEILGIGVRFQFVVSKAFAAGKVQRELKENYEKHKDNGLG